MRGQLKERKISGVESLEVRDYEVAHKAVARRAAAGGMVLLKNNNDLLPLQKGTAVDLYGAGVRHMIKGGTGSGDVNPRDTVDILEGMRNAGFIITNEDWLNEYEAGYNEARQIWRDDLLRREKEGESLFELYAGCPLAAPMGSDPKETDTEVAIYVLSRVSGEGADRKDKGGDFKLRDEEFEFIGKLCNAYKNVILVINAGGLVDLSFADDFANIESIIYMSQAGMEGGNALADIISGDVTPSGKLTDSWAYSYKDYPGADEFSLNGPTLDYAIYKEGIYVGYRYFDSFHKSVRYGFGFGLSYTSFAIKTEKIEVIGQEEKDLKVKVTACVTNTGNKYSGREVVQVYASCPDGRIEKEYRRLVGFAKTDELAPGESERVEITVPIYILTSYDEKLPGYVLEEGYYGIWVGNSLGDSRISAMLRLINTVVVEKTEHICPVKEEFEELTLPTSKRETRYRAWVEKGKTAGVPIIGISESDIATTTIEYGKKCVETNPEAYEFVNSLSLDKIINLATGDPGRAENGIDGVIGSAGLSIPGSAAETHRCAREDGLGTMVLSDGPAGLRLERDYAISPEGEVKLRAFMEKVENGLFAEKEPERGPNDKVYYQFCTAFPVGTLLAQTWDTAVVKEVGKAVGEEMMEFQTALWLAPGMNIHRNPLCGRNFEYYSEDPVVSGIIAAAMTDGVQTVGGCGTTIKHFACNNQEENRLHCDSRLHERALREIYLKGFEICIKSSQPMSIMTSYNLINGIHTANNYDLCSKVARDEWGFAGMIMTDWTTTEQGDDCTAAGCMRAGNDLVCPGNPKDHANLREEMIDGMLSLDEIKLCIARLVNTIWQSNSYENAPSYTEQFDDLKPFVTVNKEKIW